MVSEKSGMVFLLNGKIFSIWAIITSNYHSCTLEPPWGDRKLTDWLPKTMIFDPLWSSEVYFLPYSGLHEEVEAWATFLEPSTPSWATAAMPDEQRWVLVKWYW